MENLKEEGFVYSYNIHPQYHSKYPVKKGDKIEWKRNGERGSTRAIVLGFSDEKPEFVFVENCQYHNWESLNDEHSRVWIKKNNVLSVIKEGIKHETDEFLKEKMVFKNNQGLNYVIQIYHNATQGFSSAYHEKTVIGSVDYKAIKPNHLNDDYDWSSFKQEFLKKLPEIKNEIESICKEKLNKDLSKKKGLGFSL